MHVSILIRVFIGLALLTTLGSCHGSEGTYTIGVVVGTESFGAFGEAFKDYMHVLGYIEDENVQYDIYVGDLNKQKVEEITERFLKKRVDLIVTVPTGATSVAQAVTKSSSIPIVFGVAQTEGTGIINSINRPGKNSTGVRFPAEELAIRRLDYLLQLVPDVRTILIPHRAGHPGVKTYFSALEERAEQAGKRLIPVALSSTQDFNTFMEEYSYQDEGPVDAILQLPDPVGSSIDYFEIYGQYAMNKDIVVGGDYLETDDITSTFGIQVDVNSVAREVAFLANRVLKGARAGSLAVLNPEPELTVNLKELQRLGIDTPYEVLYEADLVIR